MDRFTSIASSDNSIYDNDSTIRLAFTQGIQYKLGKWMMNISIRVRTPGSGITDSENKSH